MCNTIRVNVPPELASNYFFPNDNLTLKIDEVKKCDERILLETFHYEVAYYKQLSGWHPWRFPNVCLPKLFNRWAVLQEQLEHFFQVKPRDYEMISQSMKQGIIIFIQCLHWLNGKPVSLNTGKLKMDMLKWKPLNGAERFEFIFRRPAHHHAFIQLTELMKEIEKRYYVNKMRLADDTKAE